MKRRKFFIHRIGRSAFFFRAQPFFLIDLCRQGRHRFFRFACKRSNALRIRFVEIGKPLVYLAGSRRFLFAEHTLRFLNAGRQYANRLIEARLNAGNAVVIVDAQRFDFAGNLTDKRGFFVAVKRLRLFNLRFKLFRRTVKLRLQNSKRIPEVSGK